MSIEWFRDLALCIFGLGAVVIMIFIAVLVFLFYRRLMPVMNSLKNATKTVENITSTVEVEVARPLVQVASFVQGTRQAVGLVSGFVKRKEEERDE